MKKKIRTTHLESKRRGESVHWEEKTGKSNLVGRGALVDYSKNISRTKR